MTQPEGPGEPEFVETDLAQDEGLPTARADIPLISQDSNASGQHDDDAESPKIGSGRLSNISFLFRAAGMVLRVDNHSSEESPTHRSMAATLPMGVALIAAVAIGKLFLGMMGATLVIPIMLLVIVMGVYVSLRVIAPPTKRKTRKTKNAKTKSKDKGN